MINGVNFTQGATYTSVYQATSKSDSTKTDNKTDSGVVYESGRDNVSAKDNKALIAKLKADSESRINQMQSLVSQMFEKQGIKIGTADDIWKTLASGNFTADSATIAQAKEDIADDGYWGVTQTSDRIFDFAKALSGGDSETMEKMKAAVEKGFKLATKSWGRTLPEISQKTYDAVMDKFDSYFEENNQ